MEKLYNQAVTWIKERTEGEHGGKADLMRKAKANKPSWYKLLGGKDVRAESFMDWLDNLGFRLVLPQEPTRSPSNLPTRNPSQDNAMPHSAMEQIAKLEQELEEKDKQIAELTEYKFKWLGFKEIRKLDADALAQARQVALYKEKQESILFSSNPSACAGREPEAREQLGPGGISPPEHDGTVRE